MVRRELLVQAALPHEPLQRILRSAVLADSDVVCGRAGGLGRALRCLFGWLFAAARTVSKAHCLGRQRELELRTRHGDEGTRTRRTERGPLDR